MKKENQTIADFIVEFDPNTKVDIYEKVKEYKSTHGKDAYLFELPKTQEEDPKHYGNCPEEDKLELLYLNPNQLEVYSNAQRQRLDVTDDKVVRKMEEEFDWKKFTPLEAVEYTDEQNNKHYVCTEGFGRLIFCVMHPGITSIPVLVRRSNEFQEVINNYKMNHDKNIKTQVTRADDFLLVLRQGRWDVLELKSEVEHAGMTWEERKLNKCEPDDMVFSQRDINELSFQTHFSIDSYYSADTLEKMKNIICAYSFLRDRYNKGSYIRDWNTVLMNIVKEIDFLKGFYKKDNYLKTLTIKNLIKKGERCKRRGIQKYFDNATYKSGCQTIKRLKALKWIEMLMNNDGISSEWLKKSPIGDDTYINLLLRNINEKLKA